MFHRAQSKPLKVGLTPTVTAQRKEQPVANYTGMNQTAVRQYAGSQEEVPTAGHSTNQNSPAFYAVRELNEKQETKEAKPMNNPDSQAKNPSQPSSQPSQGAGVPSQARVDIPGSNFQRPGMPGRPVYPGAAYPGSSYGASAHSNDAAANGRQLLIGSGITLSGEIESCEHLVVEGTIEAALKGANQMDIAESGAFFGTVEIENADIAGRFEGDITVKGRLTVQSTGIIIGTISYKELSMEAGAVLDGTISPIGNAHVSSQQGQNRKSAAPMKSKKVSQDNGAELPFSDRAAAE